MPRASKDDINIIVNIFRYIISKSIGHDINSLYLKLFEVEYENTEEYTFEKYIDMVEIFKNLNIKNSDSNNKHAILHFDSSTNEIPKFLTPITDYFKINHRVTNNCKDFKDGRKSILVCNYRLFRGLEHSNITIIIDQDVYSVQHYLVEAIARWTNKLNVVILERSDVVSKITAKWKAGLNGQKLIEQYKIQRSMSISDSSRNNEEMRKIFDKHGNKKFASNVTFIAQEMIKKR